MFRSYDRTNKLFLSLVQEYASDEYGLRSHSNSNPVKGISRLKLALLMLDFDISCYTVSIEMESEDFLKQPLREESWSKWLFTQIFTNLKLCPSKIALVEEIGDARCVTYDELVDGVMRTVNFLSHHRVENNTYVAICMENSIEYIIYELALHFIGAIPILLNPEHVANFCLSKIKHRIYNLKIYYQFMHY
uniref:AMP-binding domain-containing protein n=1 Tax=Heterorhabditis bacteriophora TaxID=37862 RepID=A0A1I7WR28_HETBA